MGNSESLKQRISDLRGQLKRDHVAITAAGVAFFAMIGVVPLMAALISTYGLVFEPQDVREQIARLGGVLPAGAQDLLVRQADRLVRSSTGDLSIGLLVSVLGLSWSASSGMKALIEGINVAHGKVDSRSFLAQRGLALALSIAAVVGVGAALFLIAGLPALVDSLGLGAGSTRTVLVLRWMLLTVTVAAGLCAIYRHAIADDEPDWMAVLPGAALATVLWLIGSLGLSLYASNFGNYNKVYGALSGIIVLMLWLYVSAFAVLIGAELNAVRQRGGDAHRKPEPRGFMPRVFASR
jgi:membrane protein